MKGSENTCPVSHLISLDIRVLYVVTDETNVCVILSQEVGDRKCSEVSKIPQTGWGRKN